ncbi:heavy-metal-associated domain-containing protein [Spirulina sp. CS-785/01]|uniref:heavy-metal-associated domain-containing protein n=1 Tax=Spirulina sp. CS-785/01 TaxID=3021716 RepID=UPI00232FAB5B|nr:heavy-metal-associated domain-containing protein [Spirulina sp. CS-785/01]MDB9311596.1 heavy-metal-associated domain-containing protein [Spirulina sp. CS-785/01]
MTVQVKVPSMVCDACVNSITNAITSNLPNAKVQANLDTKQVTVETNEGESKIREMILDAGHEVE